MNENGGIVDLTLDTDVKEALLIKKQQVWKYCFTMLHWGKMG